MIGYYGSYDTVVVGAGVTGVIAAIAAGRAGSRTLLVEAGSFVGGMLTGGRLTRAVGSVDAGLFLEIMQRLEQRGAGHARKEKTYWGHYTGIWDPEEMHRALLETLEEANVELLLHARVSDVLRRDKVVNGLELGVKNGRRIVIANTVIDASGDADVAYLAGAECQHGRESDGLMQPMSAYVRLVNVDLPVLAAYVRDNPDEFNVTAMPSSPQAGLEDFILNFTIAGFESTIQRAKSQGFAWILPRERILMKSGVLPGEVNLNVTRAHGSALDERDLSQAEVLVRKQGYCVFDFLRDYIPGCESARLLEVAPRIGVRETRRIVGDYVLSEQDVRGHARFVDAIGRCDSPIDIHEPDSNRIIAQPIHGAYDIPMSIMLPRGLDGLLVAGRCASADHAAAASLRNTPPCAVMGETAGIAAAMAAKGGVTVREVKVEDIRTQLRQRGFELEPFAQDEAR